MSFRRLLLLVVVMNAIASGACRRQSSMPVTTPTGEFGSGTGYTAQCSGDFPDWISQNPPVANGGDFNPSEPGSQPTFQLAQAYPLGVPVFGSNASGQAVITRWDPPAANTDAPWRAFSNMADATQRTQYLDALKNYFLQGMSDAGVDFDAVKNNRTKPRHWFHVPMMTAAGTRRREPYHGVTAERGLRPTEQIHWLNAGPLVRAVAIGYYNALGGYTLGQVFKSHDLSQTDATKGTFIDGTFVFKLLFAQYLPGTRIIAPDPLLHAPAWFVQDPSAPTNPLTEMRLLQVDVAVKDDHFASTTGWVFATFVYDESLTSSEPNPWRRLTPIGLQWGNDPTVTGTALAPLSETWINPGAPAAFAFNDHHGRAGRLIGPVDNPVSSCLSCHSTAEVDTAQVGNASAFMGAVVIPPAACTAVADQMLWFRNLPSGPTGSQAFGRVSGTCSVNTSTTGLTSLDYSLQLQEGLQAVFGFQNANPCFDLAEQRAALNADRAKSQPMSKSAQVSRERSVMQEPKMVGLGAQPSGAAKRLIGPEPDELHRR